MSQSYLRPETWNTVHLWKIPCRCFSASINLAILYIWVGRKIWAHRRRGEFPAIFVQQGEIVRQLSIFVDESGDLGEYEPHSPYYVIACVFHEQQKLLDHHVGKFRKSLAEINVDVNEAVHTGPLIRREAQYAHQTIDERRKQIYRLLNFTFSSPITYMSFVHEKKQFSDQFSLVSKMARDFSQFLQDNMSYFQSFDRIIVYYDNGQTAINQLLNSVLSTLFFDVEFRCVSPHDYCLLQSADLICTLEMLAEKQKRNSLSRSEKMFFYKSKELKSTFIKTVRKKHFSRS